MRKPAITKKSKSIKKAMEYEITPEDKSRRDRLPAKEAKLVLADSRATRYFNSGLAGLHEVYIFIERNSMLLAIIGLLTGVWLSGFYAHANMRFESLLSFVCGVVVLIVVGMWSTKK